MPRRATMSFQERLAADRETPATIKDTWGFKTNDHNWKSTMDLIHKLVDIVSKGGKYLLNVGPTAEGEIPQPSVEPLRAMGEWLAINGESIYGTTAGPLQGLGWCRTTAKSGHVYLHVFHWPTGGALTLEGLNVTGAHLLSDASQAPLTVKADGGRVTIQAPTEAPDLIDTVVVLDVA